MDDLFGAGRDDADGSDDDGGYSDGENRDGGNSGGADDSARARSGARSAARPSGSGSPRSPLAVRMRPRTLDDVVGQQHLLGQGSPLRQLAAGSDATGPAGPSSVILWGPPGTGKTTLAHVIAKGPGRKFVELSAITAGVKDVRRVMDEALTARDLFKTTTVLFLDEIHRFNKAQQDALLPGVENRWVVLVAATTENPSFSVVSPLLSRSLLLTLKPLTDADVEGLLQRAVTDVRGLNGKAKLSAEALAHLVRLSGGDARRALTALEAAAGVAFGDADDVDATDAGAADTDTADTAAGAERRSPSRSNCGTRSGPWMSPPFATTGPGTSTTTSPARSSSRSAARTSTPHCTISPGCSRPERTRDSWPAGS